MSHILQDLEAFVRLDLGIAVIAGALLVMFWRRVLPLLLLIGSALAALHFDLHRHFETLSPAIIGIGAVVLGLAILQAVVTLLLGREAANVAVGQLIATLIVSLFKAPFQLLFMAIKRAFRRHSA